MGIILKWLEHERNQSQITEHLELLVLFFSHTYFGAQENRRSIMNKFYINVYKVWLYFLCQKWLKHFKYQTFYPYNNLNWDLTTIITIIQMKKLKYGSQMVSHLTCYRTSTWSQNDVYSPCIRQRMKNIRLLQFSEELGERLD